MSLHIAPGIELPLGVVTEPIGVFANRGYGKSWTAVDLVEELFAAGLPAVVLDIKGDWWGIRSSVDGKKDGLPFVIFGGDHADVPLEEGSGAFVARLIAEHRIPAIIDLSDFSKTKARRWTMQFAVALYDIKRRLRDPLMVVVDEADVLIPQRLAPELMELLGAMEDIAKRGRQRGLGIMVISQRVADVNKSVTDLLTTLVIGNVTGTRTRKALMDWIDDHARSPEEVEAVLSTLSTLNPGEVWVWSPAFLRLLKRVKMRKIKTFDSHATPEPGEIMKMPGRMADIDLDSIRSEMSDTIERTEAKDPKKLQARVRELEHEVEQLQQRPPEQTPVEVSVLSDEDRKLLVEIYEGYVAMAESLAGTESAFIDHSNEILTAIGKVGAPQPKARWRPAPVVGGYPAGSKTADHIKSPPASASRPRTTSSGDGDPSLSKAQRSMLSALATHGELDDLRLGFLSGYASGSGHFNNTLGALRSGGYVEGGRSSLQITQAGLDAVGDVDPLPTGQALIDYWYGKLAKAQKVMLQVLVEAYPQSLTADELGERSGYAAGSGHFNNTLGRLRSTRLASGDRTALIADSTLGEAKYG